MAFSSMHSSAARYMNHQRRASDNDESGESQEKCCCCFSLKMGVRVIAICLSAAWLCLLYPFSIVPSPHLAYFIFIITNSLMFILIIVASFMMESRAEFRHLLIPAMVTCLCIAIMGFVFAIVLSGFALAGKPIRPTVPGYGSVLHGLGFLSLFIAFPYIYYVIALRNVYDLITKETSGEEEQEDV